MNLKKPRFWDYKKPNIFAYLLLPFSFLIKIIILLKKNQKSKKFKIKTICVGNFYIGGTGKTSLSIKINEILSKKKIKSCFVKKFHKEHLDEQRLLESKGKLFLSSKRVNAINTAEIENYEIAILDDGLQDKSVNCDINIVCFNNINWIGNGLTIPSGPLREDIKNLREFKHVFLNGNLENLDILEEKIFKINPKINIHIGKYIPLNLNQLDKKDNFFVFSGIGNHKTFISMIKSHGYNVLKEIEFPDHYRYSIKDIEKILFEANKLNCKVITTEKDYFRIIDFNFKEIKFVKSDLQIVDEEKFINSII